MNAHDVMEKVTEDVDSAERYARRWVPIAAAVLAVLAAFANLLSSQRSTESLIAKNDAILATTSAADQYAFYQARRQRETIYRAAIDAGTSKNNAKLAAIAATEKAKEAPVLAKARKFEESAAASNERSERRLHAHEILEVAATLFEIAIVLVSISAIAASPVLTAVAAIGTIGGIVMLLYGMTRPI